MDIKVNGEPMALPAGQSGLVDVLALIGLAIDQAGIAVALNMELVPRSEWLATVVKSGDEIEVITARQGG